MEMNWAFSAWRLYSRCSALLDCTCHWLPALAFLELACLLFFRRFARCALDSRLRGCTGNDNNRTRINNTSNTTTWLPRAPYLALGLGEEPQRIVRDGGSLCLLSGITVVCTVTVTVTVTTTSGSGSGSVLIFQVQTELRGHGRHASALGADEGVVLAPHVRHVCRRR